MKKRIIKCCALAVLISAFLIVISGYFLSSLQMNQYFSKAVWCSFTCGLFLGLLRFRRQREYEDIEHGSARWGRKKDFASLTDSDPYNTIILDCPQLRMEDTQNPSSVKEQGKVRLFPINPVAVQLPSLACRIYSFLTSLAGRVRECSASRKTIADACGVTSSTVTKSLSLLCREGFLYRIRQTRWAKYGHHGTRANLFVLTSPCRKLSSAALRCMIAVSLLALHAVSLPPAKNRALRRASVARLPRFLRKIRNPPAFVLSLTPSPCAQLTPQGTNVLTKVTVSLTGINRSIPEDEWKNIQAPFMRSDWSIMHGLRRGEWLKIGGCPFSSDYFT